MRRWLHFALPGLFFVGVVSTVVFGQLRRGGQPSTALEDPVCGMEVARVNPLSHGGREYDFCTTLCRERFLAQPDAFTTPNCLVCRSEGRIQSAVNSDAWPATWQGTTYVFCSSEHRREFRADPSGYFLHSMWGIPNWLYYFSIALVLLVSFGLFEWWAKRAGDSRPIRVDLLRLPGLRTILVQPRTRFVARLILVLLFIVVLAAGLFGHQLPGRNLAPLLTWTVWWGGLVWFVLFLGKAWCYACPWDAIADWAEGLRLWGVKRQGLSLGLRWPRFARNIWPATILFVGLTWIELGFGVTMNPRATAWLGLGLLAMGFVSAFVFDRRSFCRYGCLVGRISGLYALFAPVEVRARNQSVCRSCTTKSCLNGNERGEPCPTAQYLGSMQQNTYCISCLECVKSCESENVGLRLRPWASDLGQQRVRSDEAYLSLLMLSLTAFHGLTMTGMWQRIVDAIQGTTGVGYLGAFSAGMLFATVLPGAVYAGLVAISRWFGGSDIGYRQYFLRYAYALLPIALFYHLAHNSEHLFMEGQRVVALASDPMGFGWDLFGTAGLSMAPLADLPTLWFLQVCFVMIGHVYSLWVARQASVQIFGDEGAAIRSQIPMLVAMIAFSLLSLWLLKLPMEMRSSAM